jgi:hypothetical protein
MARILGAGFAFFALMSADLAIVNFRHPNKAEALLVFAAVAGWACASCFTS